jgi:hypothetical protein
MVVLLAVLTAVVELEVEMQAVRLFLAVTVV